MNVPKSRFAHIPGRMLFSGLVNATIAFGQGAWYPIAELFSHFQAWRRRGNPSEALAVGPTRLPGTSSTRRALLRKPPEETAEHPKHEHKTADTVLL